MNFSFEVFSLRKENYSWLQELVCRFDQNLKKQSKLRQDSLFKQEISSLAQLLANLDKDVLKVLYYYSLSEKDSFFEDLKQIVSLVSAGKERLIFSDPAFFHIYKTANRVRREIHRYKGFLRFKEVKGGYLYAAFEPEFNVIVPLARHFANRFRNEKIILHDRKRGLGVFCHKGHMIQAEIIKPIPQETEEETFFSNLWKNYFETLAIKERENLTGQKRNVPLKYRKFMVEFKP